MSVERGITRSMVPFLPRYRSVSAMAPIQRQLPMARSRSQPSQRLMYCQGSLTKYIAHSRPAHSPSPVRVIVINMSGKNKNKKGPLTRMSRSGSYNDLHSSHLYTTLDWYTDDSKERQRPRIAEVDARATSVGDIYHKGPFYPDVTQSESGVSVGCSEDGSFYDDNGSQFSYGSSSAFHEITIDSELDRLDSEDGGGLKSPRGRHYWSSSSRLSDLKSPDSNRSSPVFSYADSRKRELMSSPSWEFEKTQSRQNALRVLIPAPDGSLTKERLGRKNSGGGASTPLAQSTPHTSPRSFTGPKLSIKGCWNVDDPYDELESSAACHDSPAGKTIVDESSCYSSYSEDNLSDVSPARHDKLFTKKKVKLTKKASDLPAAKRITSLVQSAKPEVSEESFEGIHVPPLESVLGELDEAPTSMGTPVNNDGKPSWWAVFNIGSANARREEEQEGEWSGGEDRKSRTSPDQNSTTTKIKIVKPANTGIPLISAGKHGQDKLRHRSRSSPPAGGEGVLLSPASFSPYSTSDQSDDGDESDVHRRSGGHGVVEPSVKRECRECAEDVLKKAAQHNLNVSGTGAFDVVRASSTRELECEPEVSSSTSSQNSANLDYNSSSSINDKEKELSFSEENEEKNGHYQGGQPIQGELIASKTFTSYVPCVPSSATAIGDKLNAETIHQVAHDEKHQQEEEEGEDDEVFETITPSGQLVQTQRPIHASYASAIESLHPSGHLEPPPGQKGQVEQGTPLVSVRDDVDNVTVNSHDTHNDGMEEADCRFNGNNGHYGLDHFDAKDQDAKTKRSAIFTPPHRIPGEQNTQVVGIEPTTTIADVGGSRCSRSSSSSSSIEGLAADQSGLEKADGLTSQSQTPGIEGKHAVDNSSSSSNGPSFEKPADRVDGFSLSGDDVKVKNVRLTEYPPEKEIDTLCSEFKTVLKISDSDPDATLVQEEDRENDDDTTKSYLPDDTIEAAPFSFEITFEKEEIQKAKNDDDNDHQCSKPTSVTSDSDKPSSDKVVLSSVSDHGRRLDILSGNVGLELEESKQKEASCHQALGQSSLDPDQQGEDNSMEWIFIDPRRRNHGRETSIHDHGKRESAVMGVNEGGIESPMIVSVVATAQLPRNLTDEGADDRNQRWLDANQEMRYNNAQDGDSHSQITGQFPVVEHGQQEQLRQQDLNANRLAYAELSELMRGYDERQAVDASPSGLRRQDGIERSKCDLDVIENIGSHAEYSQNIDDGSIKYPSRVDVAVDGGNLRRMDNDKGIPHQWDDWGKPGTAQNEVSAKDGDERLLRGESKLNEIVLSPPTPSRSPTTTTTTTTASQEEGTERRAETECSSLSQQVRHIHRKTIEETETVTVERSSTTRTTKSSRSRPEDLTGDGRHSTPSSSSPSSSSSSSQSQTIDDHSVEFITNRKETVVIHEEDEYVITKSSSVSFVPCSSSSSSSSSEPRETTERFDHNVSSRGVNVNESRPSGDLFFNVTSSTRGQNPVLPVDITVTTHSIPDYLDCPPPLPSTPPPIPSTPPPEPLILVDTTPVAYNYNAPFHPSSQDAHVIVDIHYDEGHPVSEEFLNADTNHRNELTFHHHHHRLAPPTSQRSNDVDDNDPSLDPFADPIIIGTCIDVEDNKSMVIEAELEMTTMKPVSPVPITATHAHSQHRTTLDHLQAQLSQISQSGGFDFSQLTTSPTATTNTTTTTTGSTPHPLHHRNVYHDHGEATTTTATCAATSAAPTTHVFRFQGEATASPNKTAEYKYNSLTSPRRSLDLDPMSPVSADNNNTNTSGVVGIPGIIKAEQYDNDGDYDYLSFDQTKGIQQQQTPSRQQQQNLLKSGQMKTSSSLWTLKEETDSLLEALSPVSSPKRMFSAASIDEKINEPFSTTNNNTDLPKYIHEKTDESDGNNECDSDNRKFASLLTPFGVALEQRRRLGSESSDVDESDGNYSSISTAESSSFRSSGYGREQTPLSDSDSGVPWDNGADKLDYRYQYQAEHSPWQQRVDGISSFNEFVNGLESDLSTTSADWDSKSHAPFSNNGLYHQESPPPVNFGESPDDGPTTFKSSLAFCVSSPPPPPLHHHQQDVDEEMIVDESRSNVNSVFHQPLSNSNNNVPFIDNSSAASRAKLLSRSVPIPPFPIVDGEYSLNDSTASSSNFPSTDDAHSEASSRLYALDLDLSRISSCASPTPSDFSDGSSMFTCKGTAEIKQQRQAHSVSFEDDYDMVHHHTAPTTPHIPTSTPNKPLKSVLKKPQQTPVVLTKVVDEGQLQAQKVKDTYHETWVKQFDKILEDFNIKTYPLGPGSDVAVQEDAMRNGSATTTSSNSRGPNFNDLYKTFTNDDVEKKQNHLCPVVEDDNMGTFRFKRFLKKSHHKRNSKGRRLVRFLSRLSCVSESVHSPDLSDTRKRAKLDNGQAYGTDFVPPPPDRVHPQPLVATSLTFQHSNALSHVSTTNNNNSSNKESPSSSNHSLDSSPSRTDSAYSSVSESLSGMLNSPRSHVYHHNNNSSSRFPTNSTCSNPDSSDHFYLDSVHSSTSDYSSLRADSESCDPFSPRPLTMEMEAGGGQSKEMLTALSDVFDQLDVCEGEIDTALLTRLRSGHHAVHFNKDA